MRCSIRPAAIYAGARAGHLPPILVGPDGAEVLPLPHAVLLGALDDARFEERTIRLAFGDVLLLYTDGLVERRDRPVEESVDQLTPRCRCPRPGLGGLPRPAAGAQPG
ncbi:SpoIIE family protein phosphatase [Kitasatospora sp. NPDC058190]|uniref:SpoIIE family protein phosphatase n=1 Tax=Kitasatospora sp. NPDC058190 TaxID=3346371 RepID=UPI0036DBADFD